MEQYIISYAKLTQKSLLSGFKDINPVVLVEIAERRSPVKLKKMIKISLFVKFDDSDRLKRVAIKNQFCPKTSILCPTSDYRCP